MNDNDPKIGPTGDYPVGGPIKPDDQGGLNCAISCNEDGIVIVNFGGWLQWIGMPQGNAIEFACLILKNAGATSVEIELASDANDMAVIIRKNYGD